MSINRNTLISLRQRVSELDAEIGVALMEPGEIPKPEEEKKYPSIELIQAVVAKAFHQPVAIMKEKARPNQKAWPRMIAMALSRELTQATLWEIGGKFGGKDHATVIHAVKAVRNRCDVSSETATMLSQFRECLKVEDANGAAHVGGLSGAKDC